METKQKKLPVIITKLLRIIIQIFIPLLFMLGSVRLLLVTAKSWIPIEYQLPGFPDDPYGFSLDDRLKWSAVDLDYLLNDAQIDYFDQFHLDSGDAMHNERELRHMVDVKVLVQKSWLAFRIGLILLIFLFVTLGWDQGYTAVWETIRKGALWALILLGLLVVGLVVGFGLLFVGFHKIFFEGETWIFSYSDTFIRLYPERFWRDVFIVLAGLTAFQSGLVFWLSRLTLGKGKNMEVSN